MTWYAKACTFLPASKAAYSFYVYMFSTPRRQTEPPSMNSFLLWALCDYGLSSICVCKLCKRLYRCTCCCLQVPLLPHYRGVHASMFQSYICATLDGMLMLPDQHC